MASSGLTSLTIESWMCFDWAIYIASGCELMGKRGCRIGELTNRFVSSINDDVVAVNVGGACGRGLVLCGGPLQTR